MTLREYRWRDGAADQSMQLSWVPGTDDAPYPFGGKSQEHAVHLSGFFMLTTPVTQALWVHVMGVNPAVRRELCAPVENVSWNDITEAGGFLDRLNASEVRRTLAVDDDSLRFRLPSETEWEYAARGGSHWPDGFAFSGSNNPDVVAWYGPRWMWWRERTSRLLGLRIGWRVLGRRRYALSRPTRTHAVGTKAPNQLGLYDFSGNVWEWCQDVVTDDWRQTPRDGRPYEGPGDERRLRGGCHNNWDLHCTVAWRYGIEPTAHDGDIGVRVVLAQSDREHG